MIMISDDIKKEYAKYIGSDGYFVIDDKVPEDLKSTFQYFNDKKIKILEVNSPEDLEPDDPNELVEDEDGVDTIDDGSEYEDASASDAGEDDIDEDAAASDIKEDENASFDIF